ncbi:MAG: hypothetical protein MRQ13_01610 [Candidatus Midichloria sp.]|nr:hypothetical protein [Candidatus Midichloria sp.]
MPFANLNGIGVGAVITIDEKGPLPLGNKAYSLHSTPPAPQARKRVGEKPK